MYVKHEASPLGMDALLLVLGYYPFLYGLDTFIELILKINCAL